MNDKNINLVVGSSNKNLELLKNALDKVQGNSKVNILDVNQILSMFQKVEKTMDDLGVKKTARSNVEFCYQNGFKKGGFGCASTSLKAIRNDKNWVITQIDRVNLSYKNISINLTEAAIQSINKKINLDFEEL